MSRLRTVYMSELRFGKFGHLKDGSQIALAQPNSLRVCKSAMN